MASGIHLNQEILEKIVKLQASLLEAFFSFLQKNS